MRSCYGMDADLWEVVVKRTLGAEFLNLEDGSQDLVKICADQFQCSFE